MRLKILKENSIRNYLISLIILSILMVVLSLFSYFMLNQLLNHQELNATIINVSGRQRMLTQRIAYLTLKLSNSSHADNEVLKNNLSESINLMQETHNFLINNLSWKFEDLYMHNPNNLNKKVIEYIKIAGSLLHMDTDTISTDSPFVNKFISDKNNKLLSLLNTAVVTYQKRVLVEINNIQVYLSVLVAAILILMLYGALKVFRPMLKQINNEKIKLENANIKINSIINGAVDSIVTINDKGIIETANYATEILFQFSKNELIGKNIKILMPNPYHDEHDLYIQNYLKTNIAKIIGIGRETIGQRKDNSIFPIHVSVAESVINGKSIFTGFIQDITKLKEAQEDVVKLSLGIIEIREEERDRISREIHDDLGTSLSLLKLMIQSTFAKFKKNIPGNNFNIENKDLEVIDYLDNISESARQMSHTLSPIGMKGLGITAAIIKLINKIDKISNKKIEVNIGPLENFFENNWNINLYRIIQESLSNINKHAKATQTTINSILENDSLIINITDNGEGFNLMAKNSGIGLALMKQRAKLFNGVLSVSSQLGKGTQIKIIIPKVSESKRKEF